MSIPEDRMSTEVVEGDFLTPDNRTRAPLTIDYEAGPIALSNTSEGMYYQNWTLTWDAGTGNFVVTAETTLDTAIVITVPLVIQCSFAFDQNGHVNLAYTLSNGDAYLYWYDTDGAAWVQDLLDAGTTSPTLCLDDKRSTQTQYNDVMLWYTKQQIDLSYNLYKREQRERYLTEQLMYTGVYPYIHKLGMTDELRGQLTLRPVP